METYLITLASTAAAENPLRVRLSDEIPGVVYAMRLKNWVVTSPAVAPTSMIQLKINGLNLRPHLTYGTNEGMIAVPYNGTGVQWEGQSFPLRMAAPMDHMKTFTVEVFGDGATPTALTGVGLEMAFWFEVDVKLAHV